MMNHFVKIFAKLKVSVWTPNFANVFNYMKDHYQNFRGALPRVLRPVALFNHMNISLLYRQHHDFLKVNVQTPDFVNVLNYMKDYH